QSRLRRAAPRRGPGRRGPPPRPRGPRPTVQTPSPPPVPRPAGRGARPPDGPAGGRPARTRPPAAAPAARRRAEAAGAPGPPPRHSTGHHLVRTGPEGWLLAERPLPGERGETKYYFCWLPIEAPLWRLAELAHSPWPVEQLYEDAKGECGLGDYQGRRWDGLR